MSNQYPPQPPPPPWGQQQGNTPGWGQQPAGPPPGQEPLGRRAPRSASIETYAAPKSRLPLLIVVGVLVLVGLVIGALILRDTPRTPPTTSPSPSASSTPLGPGQPFSMPADPDSKGRWEVLSQSWSSEGVTLEIRVYGDEGTVSYAFVAFSDDGSQQYSPEPSTSQPELESGTLFAGETARGYVFLPLPRGPATLILTSSGGHQAISALPIKP